MKLRINIKKIAKESFAIFYYQCLILNQNKAF